MHEIFEFSDEQIFFDCLVTPFLILFKVIQQKCLHGSNEINPFLVQVDCSSLQTPQFRQSFVQGILMYHFEKKILKNLEIFERKKWVFFEKNHQEVQCPQFKEFFFLNDLRAQFPQSKDFFFFFLKFFLFFLGKIWES